MSADGQRTKRRRNIAENFSRLSRVHERHRQTTERQTTDDIEREREFISHRRNNCTSWRQYAASEQCPQLINALGTSLQRQLPRLSACMRHHCLANSISSLYDSAVPVWVTLQSMLIKDCSCYNGWPWTIKESMGWRLVAGQDKPAISRCMKVRLASRTNCHQSENSL